MDTSSTVTQGPATRNGTQPLRVVVLGGGAAGWLSALTVLRGFGSGHPGRVHVTVVEAANVVSPCTADAALPFLRGLFRDIGLSEPDVLRASAATFRHGTRFDGWVDESRSRAPGHYQLFDGRRVDDGFDAGRLWLADPRLSTQPDYAHAVSLQATLCDHLLAPRLECSRPYEAPVDYGYQLDTGPLAGYLREVAIAAGVRHVCDEGTGAALTTAGDIRSIRTRGGASIEGDFFIDCSGARRALIGGALSQPFVASGAALPCDRAITVTVPAEEGRPMPPYTIATAHAAGWTHEIRLAHARVITSFYSSAHATEQQTAQVLLERVGRRSAIDRATGFACVSGRYRNPWVRNCVAIGEAAGGVEPLEAGSLDIAAAGLRLLTRCALSRVGEPATSERFNACMNAIFDEAIQLSTLHYQLTQRTDTAFWQGFCGSAELAEGVRAALCLDDDAANRRERAGSPLFGPGTYRYLLAGMGRLRAARRYRGPLETEDLVCAAFRSLEKRRAQAMRASPDHASAVAALHGEATAHRVRVEQHRKQTA